VLARKVELWIMSGRLSRDLTLYEADKTTGRNLDTPLRPGLPRRS
jgi:hypothetical protein